MAVATALTIAGSDSSGGAGIQADLKTMMAFGVFGATALTAVTVQNTMGVESSIYLSADVVARQIDLVMEDVGACAAKTGMVGTKEIVEAVAERVARHRIPNLVVDPVMIATSGARLLEDDAVRAVRECLIPHAVVLTPNAPEAQVLSGIEVVTRANAEDAARAIQAMGASNVLIKAGHMEGSATDILFDGRCFSYFEAERIPGGKVHGTGCTLSAAIASGLARGWDVNTAVGRAKSYVTRAIASALHIGKGSALLNHFVSVDGE